MTAAATDTAATTIVYNYYNRHYTTVGTKQMAVSIAITQMVLVIKIQHFPDQ